MRTQRYRQRVPSLGPGFVVFGERIRMGEALQAALVGLGVLLLVLGLAYGALAYGLLLGR